MPVNYYPAIVDRSASGFGVSFHDFPGCIANGGTVNEAVIHAEAALAMHMEAMAKDKDDIPAPSDPAEVFRDLGGDDVAGVMIRVDTPLKIERVLISLDSGLLRSIDAIAPNRSAWIAEAARTALRGAIKVEVDESEPEAPPRPLVRRNMARKTITRRKIVRA